MAKKSQKSFKSRFEDNASNESFINTLKEQKAEQLKDTIVIFNKQLEEIQFSRDEHKDIKAAQAVVDDAKDKLKDILSPFTDAEKALKDKIRYTTLFLKERSEK
jgi:hypothetical protein